MKPLRQRDTQWLLGLWVKRQRDKLRSEPPMELKRK